jgi:hypothetical protein
MAVGRSTCRQSVQLPVEALTIAGGETPRSSLLEMADVDYDRWALIGTERVPEYANESRRAFCQWLIGISQKVAIPVTPNISGCGNCFHAKFSVSMRDCGGTDMARGMRKNRRHLGQNSSEFQFDSKMGGMISIILILSTRFVNSSHSGFS